MKILFDLRGCQRWRERGIPRYIQNLIFSFSETTEDHSIYFLYEKSLDVALWHEELGRIGSFIYSNELEDHDEFDWFIFGWTFLPSNAKSIAEYLIPKEHNSRQFRKLGAIVYDFIPFRYPENYLPSLADKIQYQETIDFLRIQDAIFTISDFVKCETLEILKGYPEERIININGGLGFYKGEPPNINLDSNVILKKYDIRPKYYWIYIGGDDPRKNLDLLIKAYGNRKYKEKPLLIVCKLSTQRLSDLSQLSKFTNSKVIFTNFVNDDELITLLKNAYGMVFPSISEGLGLPVLESYALGTPVICSNTSSLKDLAPDIFQFNPLIEEEIAEKLDLAEDSNSSFELVSLNYWKSIRDRYCWSFSSRELLQTLINLPAKENYLNSYFTGMNSNLTVFVTSLSPELSGVSHFSTRKFLNNTAPASIIAYTNDNFCPDINLDTKHILISYKDLYQIKHKVKNIVFIIGNSSHHKNTITTIRETTDWGCRRIVYSHDGRIMGLWVEWTLQYGVNGFPIFLQENYPEHDLVKHAHLSANELPDLGIFGFRPFKTKLHINEYIVHSEQAGKNIKSELPNDSKIRIHQLFHPSLTEIKLKNKKLNTNSKMFIGSFGIASDDKGSLKVISTCKKLIDCGIKLELIFAGYSLGHINKVVKQKKYRWIRTYENLSNEELALVMDKVDIAIQLREKSYGEASGVVVQLLELNKKIICTDSGWFSQMFNYVHLVPPGIDENNLAREILNLSEITNQENHFCDQFSLNEYWKRLQQIISFHEK